MHSIQVQTAPMRHEHLILSPHVRSASFTAGISRLGNPARISPAVRGSRRTPTQTNKRWTSGDPVSTQKSSPNSYQIHLQIPIKISRSPQNNENTGITISINKFTQTHPNTVTVVLACNCSQYQLLIELKLLGLFPEM